MLAKLADALPDAGAFCSSQVGRVRAVVFRGSSEVYIQSRD